MAKVLYSAVVGAASGKVGAVVFCYNLDTKKGNTLRIKASPSHPLTGTCVTVRAGVKGFSYAWAWILSPTFRTHWLGWAADPAHTITDCFGNSLYLTGLNWYIWVNMNLKTIGEPRMDDIPAVWLVTEPAACTAAVGGPPYVLTVDPQVAPAANDHAVVLGAPPLSPGRYYIGAKWRILQKFGAGVAGPYDITAKYESKFGALQAGQTINCQMFYIDDRCGKASAKVADSAVVP